MGGLRDDEDRKRRAWTLAALAVGSILLWQTYWGSLLLYPFTILATWFHEMGHGLAAILAGRAVRAPGDLPRRLGRRTIADPRRRFSVRECVCQRGGAARAAGRGRAADRRLAQRRATRIALGVLAGALLLSTLIWVRSLSAGWCCRESRWR
jgi:hypothetical protein